MSTVINVTTPNDVLDGNTTSLAALMGDRGTDGEISLREAVIASNNTPGSFEITLSADTYQILDGAGVTDENNAVDDDLDIRGDLTIAGAGIGATIIDGNLENRLFHILSGNLSIKDLAITQGNSQAGNGGAILINDGVVELTNVEINNSRTNTNGGAIFISGGELDINASVFLNNEAQMNGGAIHIVNSVSVTIENTIFEMNRVLGNDGGAIHNNVGTVNVIDSVFKENETADDGAAISNGISTNPIAVANISGSEFISNSTGGGGGTVINRGELILTTSYFFDNEAGSSGGGIQNNRTASISDSTFYQNRASTYGGGLATAANVTSKWNH